MLETQPVYARTTLTPGRSQTSRAKVPSRTAKAVPSILALGPHLDTISTSTLKNRIQHVWTACGDWVGFEPRQYAVTHTAATRGVKHRKNTIQLRTSEATCLSQLHPEQGSGSKPFRKFPNPQSQITIPNPNCTACPSDIPDWVAVRRSFRHEEELVLKKARDTLDAKAGLPA